MFAAVKSVIAWPVISYSFCTVLTISVSRPAMYSASISAFLYSLLLVYSTRADWSQVVTLSALR